MVAPQRHLIPARKGVACHVRRSQVLKVINTYGSQVVDFWAFDVTNLGEYLSMEHTRTAIGRITPKVGDTLVTNRRRPILSVVEDTSPGVHDTLIASCDIYRYALLGHEGYHDNCTDNLSSALTTIGLERVVQPCPFNLFMNIPVRDGGEVSFEPPVSRPGDAISFQAEMDSVVVFSACPQDMVPINGKNCVVHDAHFEIRS